jgi:hypothetical protein
MLGRLIALVTALAVALSTLTACGSQSDPVAWADDVCGSFMPAMKKLAKRPKISYRSPQSMQRDLSSMLDNGIDGIDGMIRGLREAGDPPVDDGRRWVGQMRDALGKARKIFLKARSTIDSADTRKPAAFLAALKKISRMPGGATIKKPFNVIKTTHELDKAYRDAKSCQRLERYLKQHS